MWIGYLRDVEKDNKDASKPMARHLNLPDHFNHSDEGLTLETSAFESIYGGQIHIINPVDKTKLFCNTPHRHSTTGPLENYPFIQSE